MSELQLSPIEARVIASLAEKAIATPQYYPMTVNALMLAANQKNSRDPVMKLTEGDVGAALNRLQDLDLVRRDDSLGRVPKWRHQFQHHLLLAQPPFALLITLMLRGPQTVAEARANAAGLGGPADMEATQAALKELGDRAQPLVVLLPRAAGHKEARYAHTLSGAPVIPVGAASAATVAAKAAPTSTALLEERIRQLEERVAALEALSPKS
jgi:uncharacterized protein